MFPKLTSVFAIWCSILVTSVISGKEVSERYNPNLENIHNIRNPISIRTRPQALRSNIRQNETGKNVIVEMLKPQQMINATTGNTNNNSNNGQWKILSQRLSPEKSKELGNTAVFDQKCIFPNDERRPRCLRIIKRKKTNNLVKNTMMKEKSSDNFETRDTIQVSSNNLMFQNNKYQDTEDAILDEVMAADVDKWSTKMASNSCACYWKTDKCGCDCKGSLNYDDFQELARNFFPCASFTFSMSDGQHYALPPNFFSKIKTVEEFYLYITNTTFEYICDPTPMTSPFKGVTFTKSAQITLINVNVRRGWNWKPFEHLKSSTGARVNITLENCKLRRLTSDFASLAAGQVDTIDIYKSDLEMVGSNAFGTFENMTHFRVPSNRIRQLRRTDFPDMLYNLKELDLRNNELRNLDDDLFTNMPSLKEIFLSGNPLSVLSEATFQVVMSQAHLEGISDIPLTCDCRLQWLKKSMMSNTEAKRNMKGAICRRPAYLRGIPFDYLSKEHLRCV